jgi:AraC family transcriptional regulator
MTAKRTYQSQIHRSQVGRAQRYIRLHLTERLTLARIAQEAGSSSYHFVRLFQAYVGETPFEFTRRVRLATALRLLQEDLNASVTEIALSIGYETPAAFNKVLRKAIDLTPSQFRNLGKDAQDQLIYDLNRSSRQEEVSVNLVPEFDVVARSSAHYVFIERRGPFAEVAPPLWSELWPIFNNSILTKSANTGA